MRAPWHGLLSFGICLCLGFGFGFGAAACQPNPTVFRGEPQFAGGPRGCVAKCAADGLLMSGFVYSGEFATSCVCSPPKPPDAAPANSMAPAEPAAPPAASSDPSDADPLARRGPADCSAIAGAQAAVEGANSAQVAAEAAASAAEVSRQQQQMLQHRKP